MLIILCYAEKRKKAYEDDDDFAPTSDVDLVDSGSEREYDSDKDPGWEPTVDVSSLRRHVGYHPVASVHSNHYSMILKFLLDI